MSKLINNKDLEFLLYNVFNAEQLTQLPRFAEHDRTTFDGILNTAERIAVDYFAPHNAKPMPTSHSLMAKVSPPLLK